MIIYRLSIPLLNYIFPFLVSNSYRIYNSMWYQHGLSVFTWIEYLALYISVLITHVSPGVFLTPGAHLITYTKLVFDIYIFYLWLIDWKLVPDSFERWILFIYIHVNVFIFACVKESFSDMNVMRWLWYYRSFWDEVC